MITLLLPALLVLHQASASSFPWPGPSPTVEGQFSRFAVTTDHTTCAQIGKDVLSWGGNAADAAVASLFCLGVMNPLSSGLGGGFLMTLYTAGTGRCIAIDAREAAPSAASERMFVNDPYGSRYGYRSIAVPSELAGTWEVFRRYGSGRISWGQLLQPTIRLLQDGIVVSGYLAQAMRDAESSIRGSPSMKDFLNAWSGRTLGEGERMHRPRLLETLKRIAAARDPTELFYRGAMAEDIDKEMKAGGGNVTKADLAGYRVRIHDYALEADMGHGLSICGGPPPSGFAATQLIVSLMSALYPNGTESQLREDPHVYHRLIEAMKFAFAQRGHMGDTSYVPAAASLSHRLVSRSFLDSVLRRMSDRAMPSYLYDSSARAAREDHGTSHVAVLDEAGNAVSVTSTINLRFGSLVVSPSLGILWNDEMDDFSTPGESNSFGLPPAERNFIAPGKRPMSSMSPLVVFDRSTRKVRMVAGASGGSTIISSLAQVVTRALVFGEDVKKASDAPRFHNQFSPFVTKFEQPFPADLVYELSTFGQSLSPSFDFGVVQAITVDEGKIKAVGDFRRSTNQLPGGY